MGGNTLNYKEDRMVHVGHDNYLTVSLVAVILDPVSSHAKRVKEEAGRQGKLIVATSGHKTRSIVVLTNSQVVATALSPGALWKRVKEYKK